MESNAFTLGGLVRHLIKNIWWIVIVGIIGAGAMVVFSKTHGDNASGYRTARLMYIQNSTLKSVDPKSRTAADVSLVKAYLQVENNRAVVSETLAILKKQGITSISYNDARNNTKLKQTKGTVAVWANAEAKTAKEAVALTNAFAEAFATVAPRLIPDMPKPTLMPSTGGAAAEDDAKPLGTKKAAIYGGAAGLGLGVILAMFTGIAGNMRRQQA